MFRKYICGTKYRVSSIINIYVDLLLKCNHVYFNTITAPLAILSILIGASFGVLIGQGLSGTKRRFGPVCYNS